MSGIMNMFVAAKTTIATAVDAFFNSVTLLLNTTSTNGAQNNTFLDSSSSPLTITRNGNTTQGTFTPFSQTGWSNYFDGSSYLTVPASAAFAPGTGDFTVDGFIYPTSGAAIQRFFAQSTSGTNYFLCEADVPNKTIRFIGTSSGGGTPIVSAATLNLNQWNYFCISRTSGTVTVWCNGSAGTPTSNTTDFNNTSYTPTISGYSHSTGSEPIIGYLSGLRYINGTALSGATVPTTVPTAVTNTSLLTCQYNRFLDGSSSPKTITTGGTPSVQAFSPFLPTAAYDAAVVGGSGYFDGTSDYLSLSSTSLNLSSSDFTIETWVYATTTARDFVIGSIRNADGAGSWVIMFNDSQPIRFFCRYNGGSTLDYQVGSGTFPTNQWVHLAVTRSGANLRVFQNGTQVGTTNTTLSTFSIDNASTNYYVASSTDPSEFYTGYLSGTRLLVGTALYTTTFTPPTAPPTAITNTTLLLNYTNAGIFDSAAKNVMETAGNAQVSTTQAKWGTTSMAFDGTGDWLFLNSSAPSPIALGGGDFTVEMWLYPNSSYSGAFAGLMDSRTTTDGAGLVYFGYTNTANQIGWKDNNTFVVTGTVTQSAWNHVAVVRDSGTLKLYINGSLASSGANSTNYTVAFKYIGSSFDPLAFNGYMDDLRITRGYARYSGSTYTQPTAAFPLQ